MTPLTDSNTESCNISRDHLTPTEVKLLIEAVKNKGGWYSKRNSLLILMLFSHIVHQAGILAGFDFPVHAHLLRHACGYYLANKGIDTRTIQDYLGHANIQNTVRYTQLSAARFEGLWD